MAAVGVSFWVAGTTVTGREVDGEAGVEVDVASGAVSWCGVLGMPLVPATGVAAGVGVAMPSLPSVCFSSFMPNA